MNYNRLLLKNIQFMLNDLTGYESYMEEYINLSIESFDKKFNTENIEAIKQSDPEYYNWQIDDLAERWNEVNKVYPNNFRSAFFTQIYSAFEFKLTKICKIHHSRKVSERLFLKKGSEIEKGREYLINIGGRDFTVLNNDFEFIDSMRIIRNSFVHNEGSINANHHDWKRVYEVVKQTNGEILLNNNPEEIQEDKQPLYISKPNFNFKFIIPDYRINRRFISVVDNFFQNLLSNSLL